MEIPPVRHLNLQYSLNNIIDNPNNHRIRHTYTNTKENLLKTCLKPKPSKGFGVFSKAFFLVAHLGG